ncbi:hypothetical protein [Oleiharenicola lentus]|uniref:hypothetical protein n=1 Tax=Oleiharenicola lentus TaxID=2508720 RepID=UPI003F66FA6F
MKTLLGLLFVSLVCLAPAAELKPQKNIAAGRITHDNGQPITVDVDDYLLSIYGVSEAGERLSYSPAVKNGAFKQKLAPGHYAFNPAKIKVRFGDAVFTLPLRPVGKLWNKNQDAEDGIVQDFVWKVTGAAETYGQPPNPNNATHWHGLSLGMTFQTWRSDTNQAPTVLPEGTKLIFTLTPLSKCIDGRELAPVSIEREWKPKATYPNDHLNDLPPANYEITGIAKLPDGSTRPILFQGRGHYPKFVEKASVPLEVDNTASGYWTQLMGWVTN